MVSESLTDSEVYRYITSLLKEGLSDTSINGGIAALKSYNRYLIESNLQTLSAVKSFSYYSDQEISQEPINISDQLHTLLDFVSENLIKEIFR